MAEDPEAESEKKEEEKLEFTPEGEGLGHSTIATMMDIYSHVPLGLQREAVQTLQEGLKRYQAPEKSTPVEIGIN